MELGTYKFSKQPNQHTTKFKRFVARVKWYIRVALRLLALGGFGFALVLAGILIDRVSKPEHVLAIDRIIESEYPVLQRIAGCESEGNRASKGSQFDSKGRLRTHVNKDMTVDIGKNMINSYFWELKAVELGYNIYTTEGNDAMAKWIYLNKGTGDWSASAKCWK